MFFGNHTDGVDRYINAVMLLQLFGRPTPVGLPALRQLIECFIRVGFSKFVVRPVVPPSSWPSELEVLSASVGDHQT
jgi:hypothetical protein